MKKYKQPIFMLGVWFCVYPLVTGIMYLIRSLGFTIHVAGQTFIATIILVPIMVAVIVPFMKRVTDRIT